MFLVTSAENTKMAHLIEYTGKKKRCVKSVQQLATYVKYYKAAFLYFFFTLLLVITYACVYIKKNGGESLCFFTTSLPLTEKSKLMFKFLFLSDGEHEAYVEYEYMIGTMKGFMTGLE